MAPGDYEYRGLLAATWDLMRGDTSRWADRFFYQDIIARGGQPVLDVGCGTGRLILDYLASGFDIDGVDNSKEMLALCRVKAALVGLSPVLYEQRMEALDLPRRYRTILVPSSSFQLLTVPAQAGEAMRRFFAHLEPGGVLAMPFMLLWREPAAGQYVIEGWRRTERVRSRDGATIRRWSRSLYDLSNQLEHSETEYMVSVGGSVIGHERYVSSPATRGYTQEQAVQLYAEAGFTDIRVQRDFSFDPAPPMSPIFTIVATKP